MWKYMVFIYSEEVTKLEGPLYTRYIETSVEAL